MALNEEKVNRYDGPYHWYMPSFFDELHRAPLRLVFREVPREGRVLDVGCGDARLTHHLARHFRYVVGIDDQFVALELGRLMTRIRGSAPGLARASALRLPFRRGSFDCVTAFDVIEHLPRTVTGEFLHGLRDALRPGGFLVVTTPNRRSLRNRVLGHHLTPKHYFELDRAELRQDIEAAGYQVDAISGLYLPLPLPRIEHFASLVGVRRVFRMLGDLGRRWPNLSERLVAVARRP